MIKHFLTLTLSFAIVTCLCTTAAFAETVEDMQSNSSSPKTSTSPAPSKESKPDKISEKLDRVKLAATDKEAQQLQTKAQKEIDRRVKGLNKLTEKLDKTKHLSDSSKMSLSAQLAKEVETLEALKITVAAVADIETLREQVKMIKDSYNVYGLYVPKIHFLASTDKLLSAVDKLQTLSEKLQTRIAETKAAGQSAATLETSLGTMKDSLQNAEKLVNDAQAKVLPLTPTDLTASKTVIRDARKTLNEAHQLLQGARQAGQEIVKGLKTSTSAEPTSSSSTKVSPSMAPTTPVSPTSSPIPEI